MWCTCTSKLTGLELFVVSSSRTAESLAKTARWDGAQKEKNGAKSSRKMIVGSTKRKTSLLASKLLKVLKQGEVHWISQTNKWTSNDIGCQNVVACLFDQRYLVRSVAIVHQQLQLHRLPRLASLFTFCDCVRVHSAFQCISINIFAKQPKMQSLALSIIINIHE